MGIREQLLDAMGDSYKAKKAFDDAEEVRDTLAQEYYSEKYFDDDSPGSVFTNDHGREVKVERFIQWSDNIDDRPEVIGKVRLPFGWSKKDRIFSPSQWTTKSIEDRNGNR